MWKVSIAAQGFCSSSEIRHAYARTHVPSSPVSLKLLVTDLFFCSYQPPLLIISSSDCQSPTRSSVA